MTRRRSDASSRRRSDASSRSRSDASSRSRSVASFFDALDDGPTPAGGASTGTSANAVATNETELFGVFGDRDAFDEHSQGRSFDRVVEAAGVTMGVRTPDLGVPNRTSIAVGDDVACATDDARSTDAACSTESSACVVWGEAFAPAEAREAESRDAPASPAHWLLDSWRAVGSDALAGLNGSYLAVLADGDDAFVATDPARSWACYYTDDPGVRVFGTDSAAVASAVVDPTLDVDAVREFCHLGVVLGEKTVHAQVSRAPLDAVVRADDVAALDRFVHADPDATPRADGDASAHAARRGDADVDWVGELATRLERAISRRSHYPGRSGVLLSAGYDSRLLLSQLPDVDVAYTVGHPESDETAGARAIATQYDAEHVAFEPSERYIRPTDAKVRYGQGVKESLHVHHAGYDDEMDVDTVYHGLLCDTFLTGHFLARDGVDAFGKRLPRTRLDPDPDPVDALLDAFGFVPEGTDALAERVPFASDDPVGFARDAIETELEKAAPRASTAQDRIDVAGITNQPSIPFRRHLFDNYRESFFVLDADLIDWHLAAPPAVRNRQTFLDACRRLDPNVLDNRPPDRPHDSPVLNEVERFIRRVTPFVRSFESAWPDRRDLYARNDLDDELFPADPALHDLPVRHKLRVHDVRRFHALATGASPASATDAREYGSAD